MLLNFELLGLQMTAFNGGPHFSFSPAVSFVVTGHSQAEVDHYRGPLSARPERGRCGWLVDRWGVSWQIVPKPLTELLHHPHAARRQRVTATLMAIGKLDIAALQQAFDHPAH